jgi:YegS/Rv2252/BmrU family lipid kinase
MLDIIYNPIAGGKEGKKMKKTVSLIESALIEKKIEYALHPTDHKGHAKEITEYLTGNGAENVVVIGGDGTLHEVINGFTNFDKCALGLIPCGTGNDFASALKLPKDPLKALDLILNGTPKYTDFMQMPTVRGINVIGTGIDVDVLNRYEKLKKKTKLGYTKCLIKTLFNFDYVDFTAEIEGEKTDYRSFIACIANGNVYGGGIPVCPIADPTDKTLNFLAVREMKKIKIIGAFLKLKAGKVLSLKEAEHKPIKSVKITAKSPYTVNVDGELYDDIPFEVTVVSDTLRMFR